MSPRFQNPDLGASYKITKKPAFQIQLPLREFGSFRRNRSKETSVDQEVHATAGLEAGATISFPWTGDCRWTTAT
jgi:hypothetical protein